MTTRVERPPFYRNVRFLSWTFQVAVVLIVAAILFWLIGNYQRNTAASGVPTGYRFLSNPTSFDIPGADFSPNSPVSSAYLVGIRNTISISVVGVVFATIIGVLVGIGRLSGNWLVRKLSAVYVEAIRNVPLLVIMTFSVLAIVLQTFPRIQESWSLFGWFIVSNRGLGVPWYENASGLTLTVLVVIGAVASWLVARWRQSIADRTGAVAHRGLYGLAVFVVILVAGWLTLGVGITLPSVEGRQIAGGMRVDPSFFAVLLALVVYTASHIAEIVRGSIQSVPRGQGEAATALALSPFQRMWRVVLPQAMRTAIPPLGNQYLNLIKNSSLGAAFSYFDLTNITQITVGNGSAAVPAFTLALVFYLVLSLITSAVVNLVNRHFRLVER